MENDNRVEPPNAAGERETLTGFLDYFRATVVLKSAGLPDALAAKRLLPSLTTVSGLLRHLADVERFWFLDRIDGQQTVPVRWSPDDPDAEFRVDETDSLAEIIADYEDACRQSKDVLAGYDLDDTCRGDADHNVRWVLVHMIEETGRHCGHLDILREMLDGSTGD